MITINRFVFLYKLSIWHFAYSKSVHSNPMLLGNMQVRLLVHVIAYDWLIISDHIQLLPRRYQFILLDRERKSKFSILRRNANSETPPHNPSVNSPKLATLIDMFSVHTY